MANPKKPARKRKAAKPVMAWGQIDPDGTLTCNEAWARSDARRLQKGCGGRLVRVRIVEVRR